MASDVFIRNVDQVIFVYDRQLSKKQTHLKSENLNIH